MNSSYLIAFYQRIIELWCHAKNFPNYPRITYLALTRRFQITCSISKSMSFHSPRFIQMGLIDFLLAIVRFFARIFFNIIGETFHWSHLFQMYSPITVCAFYSDAQTVETNSTSVYPSSVRSAFTKKQCFFYLDLYCGKNTHLSKGLCHFARRLW